MLFIWPAVSLAASNPYDYSLFPGGAPSRLVNPSAGAPSTLSSQSSAGASKAAVNTRENVAQVANEKCNVAEWQGLRCWTFVGFVPIYGYCVAKGACKASEVGNITGGFFNVGAQIVVGTIWGGIKNAFVGTPTVSQPSQPQCPTRYRVSVPSSDPCAVYVPPVSTSTLNMSDALLRALGPQSIPAKPPQTSVGNFLLNMAENIVAPMASRASFSPEIFPIEPGARGDIQLTTTGATIQAGLVDANRNLEVSGFFGAKTLIEAPASLAVRMCVVRPWQHAQVSAKIPASIFDAVCSGKGFKTGLPAAAAASGAAAPAKTSGSKLATTTASIATTTAAVPEVPSVKPAAAIWASPESVPLGSRTTIIWDSKGVVSCVETSPDGNFNDDRKSGRASTVAIVGPTTFIISCLAPDGSHVTDFVRVNLAI